PEDRIAGDSETLKTAEDRFTKATLWRDTVFNGLLITLWYTFSISISVYNKWMFSSGKRSLDFHFPLFTTSLHMLVQFALASTVLIFMPRFRPKRPVDTSGEYTALDGANPDAPK
ncbi:hypothetical protein LTS01_026007, partial [Friedmanniomyces endolithicus]